MKIPENLLYTEDHEWVKIEKDMAYIGITDFAQYELGDIEGWMIKMKVNDLVDTEGLLTAESYMSLVGLS